jgi:hypothetical protein
LNTIEKGNRRQRLARAYWEKKNYSVHMIHHTRWQKDIFGLFDGVAVPKSIMKKPVFFQVKSNRMPSQKPFKEWNQQHWGVKVVVMVWFDRKGWRIVEI